MAFDPDPHDQRIQRLGLSGQCQNPTDSDHRRRRQERGALTQAAQNCRIEDARFAGQHLGHPVTAVPSHQHRNRGPRFRGMFDHQPCSDPCEQKQPEGYEIEKGERGEEGNQHAPLVSNALVLAFRKIGYIILPISSDASSDASIVSRRTPRWKCRTSIPSRSPRRTA